MGLCSGCESRAALGLLSHWAVERIKGVDISELLRRGPGT